MCESGEYSSSDEHSNSCQHQRGCSDRLNGCWCGVQSAVKENEYERNDADAKRERVILERDVAYAFGAGQHADCDESQCDRDPDTSRESREQHRTAKKDADRGEDCGDRYGCVHGDVGGRRSPGVTDVIVTPGLRVSISEPGGLSLSVPQSVWSMPEYQ